MSPVYSRRQAGPDAVCSLVMSCHEPAIEGQASIMISPALALSPDFTIAMVLASPLFFLTPAGFDMHIAHLIVVHFIKLRKPHIGDEIMFILHL